jgi:ADP-ribosylglycohydrolase
MSLPDDYLERVYAGVLGKLVGVYMGRPIENMRHAEIVERYGEVRCYLSELEGRRTVVTDDDIAGTFTFFRALEDYGFDPNITSAQIGQTWLNYIIENRSILWWGGLYHSSEHTAYLNLKRGISAPESGSIERNGAIIANQIGAQIYIDAWAMTAPGDPKRAADLAERSARVSHDGDAIHAARLVAAMEALAFIEPDIRRLLADGLAQIPADCLVARLAADIISWTREDGDWRCTFKRIEAAYGYSKYVGGCHVIPNLAVILLALLAGEGELQQSLAIACTCGWDTDCNAGNLGCLLGIRGGLAVFESGPDWRGPLADRLFLSTADGGRCITDALTEALRVANVGRTWQGLPALAPKAGARFHFSLPGSVQGFQPGPGARLSNPRGEGLDIEILTAENGATAAGSAATATFILPDDLNMPGYELQAAPTLYPGQIARAVLRSGVENGAALRAGLFLRFYNPLDQVESVDGPSQSVPPGGAAELTWTIPDLGGSPIFEIGVRAEAEGPAPLQGPLRLRLERLGWDGAPRTVFRRPAGADKAGAARWRRAFVSSLNHWDPGWNHAFRIIQDRGRGMLSSGTREWRGLRVSARITPAMFQSGGIAACVQGLARFYAFELVYPGKARLLKVLDGEHVLAETAFDWKIWQAYELALESQRDRLRAWIDGQLVFDLVDEERPLQEGGVALTVFEGHLATHAVEVRPAG